MFRYHDYTATAYGLDNRGSIVSTEFLLFAIKSRSMHRVLRIFPMNIVASFPGRKAAAGSSRPFDSISDKVLNARSSNPTSTACLHGVLSNIMTEP
jgi:hypothetical protein